MFTRIALAVFCASTISVYWYARQNIRFIQLDSLSERILWTVRSWRCGYPIPLDLQRWSLPNLDEPDPDLDTKIVRSALKWWKFLEPFFQSRGYTLYRYQPNTWICLRPNPAGPKPHPSPSHPYARRAFNEEKEVEFVFSSLRVWPARDTQGREVIIRLVSGPTPSEELKILQKLNTAEARADSRNHTIHIFEYINFDGLVFVVMPRWPPAFRSDFGKVAELMQMMQAFLECFDFLHENRIAHRDFFESNTGMNIIPNVNEWYTPNMRDLSVTRYTVFDFGISLIFPRDTVLEDVRYTGFYNFRLCGLEQPNETSFNPFQIDMLFLGCILQTYVRHIEDIVPEIGPFFDSMVIEDHNKRLTAREALVKFKELQAGLTPSQLANEVSARIWERGAIITKLERPYTLFTFPDP